MPLSRSDFIAIAAAAPRRWDRHYIAAKLRSDPVYTAVEETLRGTTLGVLDIGCGLGLLTHWLRRAGIHVPMVGIDYDPRKISSALAMAKDLQEVSFSAGDARQALPPHNGRVVNLDILLFFTPAEQDALLAAAACRVAPGGWLIIRSGLQGDGWRYRITVACDWLAKLTFWMKSAPLGYPSKEQFTTVLSAAGLEVQVSPMWGNTPFNNHLVLAKRPAQPDSDHVAL